VSFCNDDPLCREEKEAGHSPPSLDAEPLRADAKRIDALACSFSVNGLTISLKPLSEQTLMDIVKKNTKYG